MKNTKVKNIKRTAFFTTLAISSAAIQIFAQYSYPTFDDSATQSNMQLLVNSQNN